MDVVQIARRSRGGLCLAWVQKQYRTTCGKNSALLRLFLTRVPCPENENAAYLQRHPNGGYPEHEQSISTSRLEASHLLHSYSRPPLGSNVGRMQRAVGPRPQKTQMVVSRRVGD